MPETPDDIDPALDAWATAELDKAEQSYWRNRFPCEPGKIVLIHLHGPSQVAA